MVLGRIRLVKGVSFLPGMKTATAEPVQRREKGMPMGHDEETGRWSSFSPKFLPLDRAFFRSIDFCLFSHRQRLAKQEALDVIEEEVLGVGIR